MKKINCIVIDGRVYEAVPKGSRHCSDCDLYDKCDVCFFDFCANFTNDMTMRYIFRYSQPLTDKINEK